MMKTYDTIVRAFQLTRSVGSVTAQRQNLMVAFIFQLTRSVGSVTGSAISISVYASISTHTLRGERDSDL